MSKPTAREIAEEGNEIIDSLHQEMDALKEANRELRVRLGEIETYIIRAPEQEVSTEAFKRIADIIHR